MENADATSVLTSTDLQRKRDLPNFAAWAAPTLVKFAEEAYTKLQHQQDAIEQYRLDLRQAMQELRTATMDKDDWR